MNDGVRVLIVDDHPVVRRGLRVMLESEPWVAEVVEAASVAEAVRQAVTQQVHVVAMDVVLPDGDGIDATRRILQTRRDARVLILTMAEDDHLVARALRAGARGFVLKATDPDAVVDALRTVAAGGVVLGPAVGAAVLTALRPGPGPLPPPFDQLTIRERDILTRLAGGDSNARIARHLGISEKTVRNQLTPIFTKLGVADRVQAALLARDAGLLD
ncbi:response regulator transcription factor [Actinoplanes sp. NPDC023714]|uniref:response regulator transcription factor n=1 Tax=Actinoplanes sp. NPDC023714 TaxID=3154322 RepID=UPI0033CFB36C